MANRTDIEGLDELIKAFLDLPEQAGKEIAKASNSIGQRILDDAKSNVPVSPDSDDPEEVVQHLKDNLKLTKARRSKTKPYRFVATVGANKGFAYIVPLELGHEIYVHGRHVGKVKARPFLRPAADKNKEYADTKTVEALNKALEKFGGNK